MNIKLLTEEDWEVWKQIRLEALQNAPTSFASSFEEEAHWPHARFQEVIHKNDIFAVFINDECVACAGFYQLDTRNTQHTGILWGMYAKPECRGQGVADYLIKSLITHAQTRVVQIQLVCTLTNLSAVQFYQKHGFKIYGTEQRSLKVADKFFDAYLMVLELCSQAEK